MAHKKTKNLEKALLERIRTFQRSDKWNRRCADCTEVGPTYVCMDYGTFVCTACSGLHRELNHKVKGVSVSKWSSEEVDFIENHGNQVARDKFMATWTEKDMLEPEPSDPERVRRMIRAKYENRLWCSPQQSGERSKNGDRSIRGPNEPRPQRSDIPILTGVEEAEGQDAKKAKERKHKKGHKHKDKCGDAFAVDAMNEDPFAGLSFGEAKTGSYAQNEVPWGGTYRHDATACAKESTHWAAFDSQAINAPDSVVGTAQIGTSQLSMSQQEFPTADTTPGVSSRGNNLSSGNQKPAENHAMHQRFSGDPFNNLANPPLLTTAAPHMSVGPASAAPNLTPEQYHRQALLAQQKYLQMQMMEIQKGLNQQTNTSAPCSTFTPNVAPDNTHQHQPTNTASSTRQDAKDSDFSDLLTELNRLQFIPEKAKSRSSLDASPTNKEPHDPFDMFS